MVHNCKLPIRARNFCNKHYLKDYFSREPRKEESRGRRWTRRTTLAYEMNAVTGIPYKKCLEIVRIIFNIIADSIKRGEEVTIPGFGTFGKHNFDPHVFGYSVYFQPEKELRDMMIEWEHKTLQTVTPPC
jgi:hypothetical protein